MIIGRQLVDEYYEDERLYSTGDDYLDELLEKAFCEGYEYAQREYALTAGMNSAALTATKPQIPTNFTAARNPTATFPSSVKAAPTPARVTNFNKPTSVGKSGGYSAINGQANKGGVTTKMTTDIFGKQREATESIIARNKDRNIGLKAKGIGKAPIIGNGPGGTAPKSSFK